MRTKKEKENNIKKFWLQNNFYLETHIICGSHDSMILKDEMKKREWRWEIEERSLENREDNREEICDNNDVRREIKSENNL